LSEAKPCLLKLFQNCHVAERGKINIEYGSLEWLQVVCTLCIKAVYARRFKSQRKLSMSNYSVVSTL
jgi:hypothetical protein